jgi:hypothetical protein
MARFNNTNNQEPHQSPLIIPPSARQPDFDFDEEKIPVSQQLGDFSDKTFGFLFNPNVIKFGIYCSLAFALR